jgi:hypothetical protein
MKIALAMMLLLQVVVHAGGLEFKSLVVDQDATMDASIVVTDFEFTNKGDKPVTITKCDPTCTCLTVEISGGKLKYAPGESGIIRTTFDVGNSTGIVEKGVAVFLDKDPLDKPSLNLQVNIHVPVLVALEPKTLSWELGSKPESKTIHIKIADGHSINVVDVKSKESFSCELKTIEKGSAYDLVVTPKSVDSPDLGVIRIETDSKIAKQKTQQAFAVVRKALPTKEISRK